MLECKTYTYTELSALFGTRDSQGIKRRLDRLEISYTTRGRSTGLQFTLTEIRKPFKVYCILDFSFSPQTDFTKLAFFTYYLLCDDEFQQFPVVQMEERLRADGHTLSRQTIKTYLSHFEDADLICRGIRFTYYFAVGKSHKNTDETTYKRAWAEYWERIHQGCPWEQAIGEMCATYGGVARKHPQLVLNAFYNHMYGQIIDWALEAMNVEPDKSD